MEFWAEGNDECQVDFTIVNTTNARNYTVDYLIDDEEATGTDYGTGPMARRALASTAQDPSYPGAKYERGRDPETSNKTITLNDPEQVTELPNAEADEHTVRYRMILGADKTDRGSGEFYTTTVTGCAEPEVPEAIGSMGSVFGSLFGSLGSTDPEQVTN